MTSTQHPSTDGADRAAQQPSRQGDGKLGLLVCGIVAGPLFFAIFSIAGALRSNYDPLRHPISSLMFGPGGWVQSVNFLLTGTLVTLFDGGSVIGSRTGRWPYGAHLAHGGRDWAHRRRPVRSGSVERISARHTTNCRPPPPTGWCVHDLCSTPVFTALPAACIVLARRFAKNSMTSWAVYSAISGALMVIFFVLSGVAFAGFGAADPDRGAPAAPDPRHWPGFWIAAIGWRFIRSRRVQALPSARALSPRSPDLRSAWSAARSAVR